MKHPYLGQLVKCPDGYVGQITEIQNDRHVVVEVTRVSAWDIKVLEPWVPPVEPATEAALFKFSDSLKMSGLDQEQVDRVINDVLGNGLLIRERT